MGLGLAYRLRQVGGQPVRADRLGASGGPGKPPRPRQGLPQQVDRRPVEQLRTLVSGDALQGRNRLLPLARELCQAGQAGADVGRPLGVVG